VAVDDLPQAVLASVDVGDPQGVSGGLAVGDDGLVLEADRVGEVGARTGRYQLELVLAQARETAGEPAESTAHLGPPASARHCGAEQGERVAVRPRPRTGPGVATAQRAFGRQLTRQHLAQEPLGVR
jgi:hypothetical protein